jgi:hypothetical protein
MRPQSYGKRRPLLDRCVRKMKIFTKLPKTGGSFCCTSYLASLERLLLSNFRHAHKFVVLRPTPPCFQQGPLRRYSRILQTMRKISARPFPCGVGSLRKRKGCRLRNHDYFFHACAFIIRQNNPFYASIIGLFSLDNKKEKSFF